MQETGICGICDHDRKTDQGRSTTTVSAGVDDSQRKRRTCQPAEVEEETSLTPFFYDTYKAANSVCSSSPGSFQNLQIQTDRSQFYYERKKLPLKTNICSAKIEKEQMFFFYFIGNCIPKK